ncbi:MAG: TIGR01777 family protein [Candidatus Omnitrophica bacterium]|nr:TIGR01777 family protein [Candidatus Omnitrophota bacterium]
MKIIVAGGTGFVGKPLLSALLDGGHTVILLTRNSGHFQNASGSKLQLQTWDAQSTGDWTKQLEGADAVINLTGEGVAGKRWTAAQKKILLRSRIDSTHALVQALSQTTSKPKVLINASAIGYYGNIPAGNITETSAKGTGFLADLCDQWEKEALTAEALGIRVVRLRIGIVLERDGGALNKMLLPFKVGAGGPVGSGKQWLSWIHRDDLVAIILYALENPELSGAVNGTAPAPVTMKEFASSLGKALHRPAFLPVPGFVIKLLLGEMSSMLLDGQRALPEKLSKLEFRFKYPDLSGALKSILIR